MEPFPLIEIPVIGDLVLDQAVDHLAAQQLHRGRVLLERSLAQLQDNMIKLQVLSLLHI